MGPLPLVANDVVLMWVQTLTGLEPKRVREAAGDVGSWNIPHLSHELLSKASIDNAVAVVQLRDAVEALRSSGVPASKLFGKLRRDRYVWPTWAELRAAALLLRVGETQITLEADRKAGKHSDFTVSIAGIPPIPIEFKAIGLSDVEEAFCRRVAPALDVLLPPFGLLTLHAYLDTLEIPIIPERLPEMHASAASSSRNLPTYPQGLAGVTIVGHGGEANYTRRLGMRLTNEILLQIPANGGGWAAFYWTNGAPIAAVVDALRQKSLPKNLAGIILLGDAVAFPAASIHSFVSIIRAGTIDGRRGRVAIKSEVNDIYGKNVFTRFENSSGVRATLLCAVEGDTKIELLRRDGGRRIFPFNFVVDTDPPIEQKNTSRTNNEGMLEEYEGPDSVSDLTRSILGLHHDSR